MTANRRAFATGLAAIGLVLSASCGKSDVRGASAASSQSKPAAAPSQPRPPFVPVDACSLVTKAEVEAFSRKAVAEPQKETVANLSTCYFGQPKSPMAGTRPIFTVVTLSVFTGQEGAYYAGPVAQAKDVYESTRKNADVIESVTGIGESAYWDKSNTLNAYKGKYFVTATVERDGGIELAKKVMNPAFARLP